MGRRGCFDLLGELLRNRSSHNSPQHAAHDNASPSGFRSAVILAQRMASPTYGGTRFCANNDAACENAKRSQMVRCHAGRSWSCSPPCCSDILQEELL